MSIQKDIDSLLSQGVIDSAIAERLRLHYNSTPSKSGSRQLTLFGLLGALLVGLGIVLIVAHNWDTLSITTRLFFACLPMIIGQVVCGVSLFKFPDSTALREGASVFLVLAIGACIAMVSQVYNIEGELGSFLLAWVMVSLPVVYVMRSYAAGLLVLIGATWHGVEVGYLEYRSKSFNAYPLFLLALLPFIVSLYRSRPLSNAVTFFSYLLPLSIYIMIGEYIIRGEELLLPCFLALSSIFYLIGVSPLMAGRSIRSNGFVVLGSLATVIVLVFGTFHFYWEEVISLYTSSHNVLEVWLPFAILATVAIVLFVRRRLTHSWRTMRPVEPVFILFLPLIVIGSYTSAAVWLVNILLLVVGLLTIREGLRKDNLGVLNYGLLILMALVISRFFDEDLSFVVRGLLFIAVGAGFFAANIRLIRKRRSENEE